MDIMTDPEKKTAREELERIEDALVDSLLDATIEDLHKEISASGGDLVALVATFDAALASGRTHSARARLERVRAELSAWQTKSVPVSALERSAAQTRFERLRSGIDDPDSKMMMAARKGEGLSEKDLEGLINDMVEVERLEREKGGG
jgi:hypothetical protein